MVVANNFAAPTPLTKENDQIWAIKIKTYLKGLSLWEVVENDADLVALPSNPILT